MIDTNSEVPEASAKVRDDPTASQDVPVHPEDIHDVPEANHEVPEASRVGYTPSGVKEEHSVDTVDIRATRGRPRKISDGTGSKHEAPPLRRKDITTSDTPTDFSEVDPLLTHCSTELREAQSTDTEIVKMKDLPR